MITALPMMKPMISPSIQVKTTPDIIGSTARKRRREILQCNRAAKTSLTADIVPNLPMDSKKKMRVGNACIDTVQYPLNTHCLSPQPDTCKEESVSCNIGSYTNSAKRNDIPAVASISETMKSKMPNYCGSSSEHSPSKVVPVKSSIKAKSTKIKQAVKAAVSQCTIPSESLDANSKKKPQMRYDPSVPMTKEAAAIWRREQRRKRNRDSAAASRQRQRNRITELEDEVSEWKKKYDDAMSQLGKRESEVKQLASQRIEQKSSSDSISELMPEFIPKSPTGERDIDTVKPAIVFVDENYNAVSPCLSPVSLPHPSNMPSDFVSLSLSQALPIVRDTGESKGHQSIKEEELNEQQQTLGTYEARKEESLIEISRPA